MSEPAAVNPAAPTPPGPGPNTPAPPRTRRHMQARHSPRRACSNTLILAVGSSKLSLTGMGTRSISLASSSFSSCKRGEGQRRHALQ